MHVQYHSIFKEGSPLSVGAPAADWFSAKQHDPADSLHSRFSAAVNYHHTVSERRRGLHVLHRTRPAVVPTSNQGICDTKHAHCSCLQWSPRAVFVSKIWQPSSGSWVNLMDRGNNFFSWKHDFLWLASISCQRKVVPKQLQAASLKTAAKAFHRCFFLFCQHVVRCIA